MSRRVERRMLIGLVGHGEDYDPGAETPARSTKDYLVLGFLLSLLLCPAAVLWAQSPPSKVIGPGTDQGIVPGASGTVGTPALSAVGPNTKKRDSSDREIQHHFQSAKSHHEQQRLLEAM